MISDQEIKPRRALFAIKRIHQRSHAHKTFRYSTHPSPGSRSPTFRETRWDISNENGTTNQRKLQLRGVARANRAISVEEISSRSVRHRCIFPRTASTQRENSIHFVKLSNIVIEYIYVKRCIILRQSRRIFIRCQQKQHLLSLALLYDVRYKRN